MLSGIWLVLLHCGYDMAKFDGIYIAPKFDWIYIAPRYDMAKCSQI